MEKKVKDLHTKCVCAVERNKNYGWRHTYTLAHRYTQQWRRKWAPNITEHAVMAENSSFCLLAQFSRQLKTIFRWARKKMLRQMVVRATAWAMKRRKKKCGTNPESSYDSTSRKKQSSFVSFVWWMRCDEVKSIRTAEKWRHFNVMPGFT